MKYYFVITSLVLLLALAACGGQSAESEPVEEPAQDVAATTSLESEAEAQTADQPPAEVTSVPPEVVDSEQLQGVDPAPSEPAQQVETDAEPQVETASSESAQPPETEQSEPEVVAETIQPEEQVPVTEPTVENWLTVEGKTDDNLAYLGNPAAPITIIDYSDFL